MRTNETQKIKSTPEPHAVHNAQRPVRSGLSVALRSLHGACCRFTLSAERDLLIHPLDVAQLAPRPGGGA